MRKEIADSRSIKTHLLQNEPARHSSLQPAAQRARVMFQATMKLSPQVLCGISPIGETSPPNTALSFA